MTHNLFHLSLLRSCLNRSKTKNQSSVASPWRLVRLQSAVNKSFWRTTTWWSVRTTGLRSMNLDGIISEGCIQVVRMPAIIKVGENWLWSKFHNSVNFWSLETNWQIISNQLCFFKPVIEQRVQLCFPGTQISMEIISSIEIILCNSASCRSTVPTEC